MFDTAKFDDAAKHLGALSEGQKAILADAKTNKIPEKELFEKLGVSHESFRQFIQEASVRETIFSQNLSEDELRAIAGGKRSVSVCESVVNINCARVHYYRIYDNQFPHCCATVEDGSWCSEADACYGDAIEYVDMKDCRLSWR